MTTQEIVSKLWNLCNVLRDDGITYHQYVSELTYILFLKMAKETGAESQIPEDYRWDRLTEKSGIELLRLSTDWTGFLPGKRGLEICMRVFWRKMQAKKNPAPGSILRLAY